MVFLSRIQLNPAHRGGQRLLASPQNIHAAVLASFPDPPTGGVDGPRVLWRVDTDSRKLWLYVASPDMPDFSHIVDQAGWPAAGQNWETRDYSTFLGRLAAGQHWRFRLVANPTRRVRGVRGADGKPDLRRKALLAVGHRQQWLVDRAAASGFAIAAAQDDGLVADPTASDLGPDLVLTAADVASFTKGERDGTTSRFAWRGARGSRDVADRLAPVTIARTRFDGMLEVVDAGLLRAALVRGIGPAKAYGCGLMTLAPV